MVARGLKNRVEVDGRKAQLGNAGQVILDTLERAAVKIPGLDGAVFGTLVLGRFVPVLDHAALDSFARFFNFGKRAFAPVFVACIAVGEDLVDHTALVPSGTVLSVLVHGNLEGRNLGVVVGHTLATGATLRCTQAYLGLALDVADKAVPDKTGSVHSSSTVNMPSPSCVMGYRDSPISSIQVRSVSVAWLGSASSKITDSETEVPVVTAPNGVRNCGRRLL